MAGRRSTGAAHDGAGSAVPGQEAGPAGPCAGDVVAGVRLTARVGRGSAGVVWAGTEVASGARVAVKLLDRPSGGREAALLAALRHPHVLPLRRAVADPPALVTDLAAGGSLADQVAARGTLTPGEVVTVLAPLADALAALHARGVVHGDVTAGNVLFVDRGRPVLADLGVAGLMGDGAGWATPGHAAPEVLAGQRPGPAADVHGLGAAGWLALTGHVPPPEPDRLPLGLLVPDCPTGLLAAVTSALDPDPLRRPAPDELARSVRAACPGAVVRLVPAAARGVAPDEAVTYRVRAAAADDPPPVVGRVRRAGLLLVGRLRRLIPGAGGQGRGPGTRRVLGPGAGGLVVGGLVVGGAVVGLLVVGTLVGGLPSAGLLVPGSLPGHPARGGGAGPGTTDRPAAAAAPSPPAPAPRPAPAAPPAPPVPASAPPTPSPAPSASWSPAGSSSTPPLSPAELGTTVSALVGAREAALRAGDLRALDLVHDPAGPAWAADARLLADGPVAVAYEVLSVAPVDDRPSDARVRLRTTAGGTTSTEDVVLTLARGPSGWRVQAVG